MTEYPPHPPDVTSLDSSWKCLLVGKLIESAHESSTKRPAYHQTIKGGSQESDKFADINMLVHVNCHSFTSRLLSLQTHRH